jgi:predicted ArsR family transcriptional regulator
MTRERNDQGKFVGTITDVAVIDAVRAIAPAPATASDVADELGCTRKAAWEHLTALHGGGSIERKKVGGRSVVWWLTDEERARGGPADPLFGLVGLFEGDDEAAARARERSEEWGETFDEQMMSDIEDASTDENEA